MYGRKSWANVVAVKSKAVLTPNQLTPELQRSKNRYVVCTLMPAEDGGQFVEFELTVTCTIPGSTICPNHGTVPGGVMVPLPTSTRPPDCGSGGAQLFPKYCTLPPSPRLPHVSSSYVVVKFDPPIQLSPVIASVSAPVFHVRRKLLVVTVLLVKSIDTPGTGVLPVAWANAIGAAAIASKARKVETIPKLCAVRVSLCIMPASTSITRISVLDPRVAISIHPTRFPLCYFFFDSGAGPLGMYGLADKSVGQPTWSGVPSWDRSSAGVFRT